MIELIALLLFGNIQVADTDTFLLKVEAEKPLYAGIMKDVFHSQPKYWKRRFKRALEGKLILEQSCRESLYFAPKQDIKYLKQTAKEYGIEL